MLKIEKYVRNVNPSSAAPTEFFRNQGQALARASNDGRMTALARAMDIPVFDLESG